MNKRLEFSDEELELLDDILDTIPIDTWESDVCSITELVDTFGSLQDKVRAKRGN